jgi:hypothetical protein
MIFLSIRNRTVHPIDNDKRAATKNNWSKLPWLKLFEPIIYTPIKVEQTKKSVGIEKKKSLEDV